MALPSPILPGPPPPPNDVPLSQPLRTYLERVRQWSLDLTRTLESALTMTNAEVNGFSIVGDDLASASEIALSRRIHKVTGTAVISTIVPPAGFSGLAYLIADAAWTLTTGGNIAVGVAPLANQALPLIYVPAEELWYPSV